MTVYHCQSTHHEGNRLLKSMKAGYTARLDYRSLDNRDRPHSKTLRVVCYPCMEKEWAIASGTTDDQGGLFE